MIPVQDLKQNPQIRVREEISWLPERYRNRSARIRLKFQPTPGERRIYRRKRKEAPSKWAPKYRRITYGPLKRSNYDPNFMPHMNGIIDTFVLPFVRELGNCKSPQSASSAGAETAIGYLADNMPDDALIVYPDRDTASKRSRDYLSKMFTDSPRLRKLLTGVSDDVASLRIRLQTMLIYMGWAGSVTSLGNVSVRYLILDEVDKYVEQASKKEAATVDLAKERIRAFGDMGKIWWNSTPSLPAGPITKFMEGAQVVFDYHLRCVHCKQYFYPLFSAIDFGGIKDPAEITAGDHVRMICPECGSALSNRERIKSLPGAEWFAREKEWKKKRDKGEKWSHDPRPRLHYLLDLRPVTVCFHSPGWISPLVSLDECAIAFLRGLKDKMAMQYFANQIAAEAFVDYKRIRKEDAILALRDERPEGLVPGYNQVAALVAGGDTQDDGFYYWIMAIGWGIDQPWWLIRAGKTEHLHTVKKIMFEDEYKDIEGNVYPVHLLVQDAMGHRTSEIYDFALLNPGRVVPYKGAAGRRATPFTVNRQDSYPGTKKPIPGGVNLYT